MDAAVEPQLVLNWTKLSSSPHHHGRLFFWRRRSCASFAYRNNSIRSLNKLSCLEPLRQRLNSTQLFIPVGIRTAMTILRFVEKVFLYFVVPPSGWDPIRRIAKGGLLIAQGETRRVTQDTTKVDNNGDLAYLLENNST